MRYDISLSERGKYIRITILGDITVDTAWDFTRDSMEASSTHGVDRFLYDARQAQNLSSVLENYKFAYEGSKEMELSHSARSAILAAPDDKSHQFVVTAFRNAGFNVLGFTDEEAAVAWLEED